jgi:hypothetical protein
VVIRDTLNMTQILCPTLCIFLNENSSECPTYCNCGVITHIYYVTWSEYMYLCCHVPAYHHGIVLRHEGNFSFTQREREDLLKNDFVL